jgi:hypothetical protein
VTVATRFVFSFLSPEKSLGRSCSESTNCAGRGRADPADLEVQPFAVKMKVREIPDRTGTPITGDFAHEPATAASIPTNQRLCFYLRLSFLRAGVTIGINRLVLHAAH